MVRSFGLTGRSLEENASGILTRVSNDYTDEQARYFKINEAKALVIY